LQDNGFEPGSVDGVIDTQTQSAISQFQRDNNLPASGTVDEQTAKWLGVENRAALRAVSAPRAARRRLADLNKL